MTSEPTRDRQPVAVIGIGCRFPGGANDAESFWELLLNGVDTITEIPSDRWNLDTFYHTQPGAPGKAYARQGGFIENIDLFEPECFRISPREAAFMDPQQRLLLEVAWEALEDAGIPAVRFEGSPTGVFVGISTWDYAQIQTSPTDQRALSSFSALGTSLSIAANRISYCLDLRGPSMAVDTACSSSLVAVDRALNSLRNGECRMAIAGGVNVITAPETVISYCAASLLSPEGRCAAYDVGATGFVRGEGAGVVLLKPLEEAQRDGDPILAVILGSGVNQDGRSASIAVPNGEAQRLLLEKVYESAGVEPGGVGYIEGHGTGTPVGDPIEATSVGRFFSPHLPVERRLLLGSVKTNIGHLEAASGVAALIKLILCVSRRSVPPNLHFHEPNPKIDFDGLRLCVPTSLTPWPEDARPAIGGVNSFGFGGTNAHLVVSEYIPDPKVPSGPVRAGGSRRSPSFLLPITARTKDGLRSLASQLADLLSKNGPEAPQLADVCYSASLRRTHHDHRLATVVGDRETAAKRLQAFAAGESVDGLSQGSRKSVRPKLVFIFSGQGTQWARMGLQLMVCEPVFAEVLERCEARYREFGAPWSLLKELQREGGSSRLRETSIAQPAIFAVQAGLVELWRSWGIVSEASIGHSIGEVAAAYAAGVYDLDGAAYLAYHRGRVMGSAPDGGRMLAAELTAEEAAELIKDYNGRVSLAAVNAPRSVTLSGRPEDIGQLRRRLDGVGNWCRLLDVNHAFHRADMDVAQPELLKVMADVSPSPSAHTFVSTVTGGALSASALSAEYWWRNVRQCVRFHEAIEGLLQQSVDTFVEVGPHPALLQSVLQVAAAGGHSVRTLSSLRRESQGRETTLSSLGSLFTLGSPVNWQALKPEGSRYVKLPRHPWSKERYWNEASRPHRLQSDPHELLGRRLMQGNPAWQQKLDLRLTPYLRDHRVDGKIVFPAAAYVEMATAAAKTILGAEACTLEQLVFHRALLLPEKSSIVVQTLVYPAENRIEVLSSPKEEDPQWTLHFSTSYGECGARPDLTPVDLDAMESRLDRDTPAEEIYGNFRDAGLEFGSLFRGIQKVRRGDREALGRIELPAPTLDGPPRRGIHPALLDSCFQVLSATLPPEVSRGLFLPERIDRVRLYGASSDRLWSHARLRQANELRIEGDLSLYSPNGLLAASVEGFRCRRTYLASHPDDSSVARSLYEIRWKVQDLPATSDQVASPVEGGPPEPSGAGEGSGLTEQTWLVFADRQGLGGRLAAQLRERGRRCVVVHAGTSFEVRGEDEYVIAPESRSDMLELVRGCTNGQLYQIRGITHLWSLDEAGVEPASSASASQAEAKLCHSLMHLVQALDERSYDVSVQLFLVTCGARDVELRDPSPAFHQMCLVGLGRVIANELHHYQVRLVDLDPGEDASQHDALLREILPGSSDEEVAIRAGTRWVPRIERAEPERARIRNGERLPEDRTPIRLQTRRKGALDSLQWLETRRASIGTDEVEIAVTHAGLNFRDVLKALGLYPAETPVDLRLGDECVGIVIRAGSSVEALGPGDSVVAVNPGCLQSFVTVPAAFALPLPAHYSPAQAASMPIAFLTAMHALHGVARITDKDSILIHSAAGGVGMAAVQLAKQAGATIYATAGTEEKRRLLEEMGAAHAMDSRTLSFADEIKQFTDGRGVDIVLNSLAGRAMTKSLECLAPYGRFLELGKRDIYEGSRIALWPFRKSISYFAIDLARLLFDGSSAGADALRELSAAMKAGALAPLPISSFDAGSVSEAFRTMSQGRHIGKIVIDMLGSEVAVERTVAKDVVFKSDATYLITGGLGGFGLELAQWIVENGGRHLVLLGRSDPSERALPILDRLRSKGANVVTVRCDVADKRQLAETIRNIGETLPRLRGVFHLAGVLENGILLNLDRERFAKVMQPKAWGAWNLHNLTLGEELDHFIMFSSISTSVGNPGQGNYVAANAFLEGLATYRRSIGLPAKAIGWGLVSDVGMAENRQDLVRIFKQRGMVTMTAKEYLEVLPQALQRESATCLIARFDWDRVTQSFGRNRSSTGLLSSMLSGSTQNARSSEAKLLQEIQECPLSERLLKVEQYLSAHIARILAAPPERIDVERPLSDLGFDSLMLVELALLVQDDLGPQISSASVSPAASIRALAKTVAGSLEGASGDGRAAAASTQPQLVCTPIPIRLSGDLDPLFLIHPLGVHEGVYRPLVDSLAAQRPVYGISSHLEGDDVTDLIPIDDRVAVFVEAIREIQPSGPYFLCGYSMGGHLALKTARVLEGLGEHMAFVGVIEWELTVAADVRSSQGQTASLFAAIFRLLETRFGILAHLSEDRLAQESNEVARRMLAADHRSPTSVAYEWMVDNGYLVKNVSRELLDGYFRQFFVNFSLLADDSDVEPIEAPVYVWRARDGLGTGDRSWSEVAANLKSEEVVDGDHFSLMIPPRSELLAKKIDRRLAEVSVVAGAQL